ncbi:MAG: thiol:disulfide interchange protein DsbD [Cycloclasticus sp.]|jgi:thiol:disulfide interchange protein DsbD
MDQPMYRAAFTSFFIIFFLCLTLPVSFAAAESNTLNNQSSSSILNGTPINALRGLFGGANNDTSTDSLLEADEAFAFFAEVNESQQISLNWRIADGYYLYRDKVKVVLSQPSDIQLQALTFPVGVQKTDEIFGDTIVYYGDLALTLLLASPITEPTKLTFDVGFQGCADIGVCYPPMNKTVTLTLKPISTNSHTPSPVNTAEIISEQDQISNSLVSDALWLICLTFLGFGVLLSFTPCVFPMVPILSGIIIGHGKNLTTRKAFYLSFSYVFASACTYALFGVLAGLFGSNLQATFQNPWILGSFSVIFVLLALSMFGLYTLQLPAALQSKLSNLSQHQKHGSLLGSAVMGILSTLIVGPCVAAPLAGVLIYIGQTGDATLGGFALFSLGIGMGIPLVIIGVSAGKFLPKAGHWMEPIKYFFGVLLIAVAIWLVERILPPAVTLTLWAGLLIVCAIYLKALDRLPEQAAGWLKFTKGLGVIFLIYGIILLLGASAGGTNPLKPLANLNIAEQRSPHATLSFKRIKTLSELNASLKIAAKNDQRVMLDFYADWCISCKEMEAFTFTDPRVQLALKNTVLLQADVTKNDDEDRSLLNAFSLIGPPAILFFKPDSIELQRSRVVGYMEPTVFLKRIQEL